MENGSEDGGPRLSGVRKFRPDIQGLRAVAVLMVALNHAAVPGMNGGFIGVDVFFVISGFLITGWLLDRGTKQSRLLLRDFYAARARRILPAAALTLLVTVIACRYLLNYVEAMSTFHDAIWAAFFATNIHFAQVGTNYFAQGSPPSPLLHFWSLAVEEQFYVVWPVLMMLVLFVARPNSIQRGRHGFRIAAQPVDDAAIRRLTLVLGIAVTASLLWSIKDTSSDPVGAYFSTFARAWELGIGALLAVGAAQLVQIPRSARAVMSWVGVAGVVTSAAAFNSDTAIPGYAALLPVLSAALIIAGGLGDAPPFGAQALLGRQPLTFIGDISFAFYLWHWPVLIVAMEYEGHALSVPTNLLLLAGALALSIFTYVVYENPIRHHKRLAISWYGLSLWPATILAVVLVAGNNISAVEARVDRVPPHHPVGLNAVVFSSTAGIEHALGEAVTPAAENKPVPLNLSPPVQSLATNVYDLGVCTAGFGNHTTSPICHLGDPTARRTLVVFGDSHSQMWMPVLVGFAKTAGWDLVPLIKLACVPLYWDPAVRGVPPPCDKWYVWALGEVKRLRPGAVILATEWSHTVAGGPSTSDYQETLVGLTNEIAALRALTPKLAVVQDSPDSPRFVEQPADCLLARRATLGSCVFSLTSGVVRFDAQVEPVVRAHSATIVPTLQWFCSSNHCPMVLADDVVYIDHSHISQVYAADLKTVLIAELDKAIG